VGRNAGSGSIRHRGRPFLTMRLDDLPGFELLPADLAKLQKSGITPALAARALLRRVDSVTGGNLVGRNGSGDYSGIIFPYAWPGEDRIRDCRLRRDKPDLEQKEDGTFREKAKYLSPPGRANMLYLIPGVDPAALTNETRPIILTEGEKKALSLDGLGQDYLAVGLGGVWNFQGVIGKAPGPAGDRRDVKGIISDIERITWRQRKVIIVFDRNVQENGSVAAARWTLTKALRKRHATVYWFEWPADTPADVNGVDDLIGLRGAAEVLRRRAAARMTERSQARTRSAPMIWSRWNTAWIRYIAPARNGCSTTRLCDR